MIPWLLVLVPWVPRVQTTVDHRVGTRDRWLKLVALGSAVGLLGSEPWLGLVGVSCVLRWRNDEGLSPVLVWAAASTCWVSTLHAPPWAGPAFAWSVGIAGVVNGLLIVWQWAVVRELVPGIWTKRLMVKAGGLYGQRTYAAALMALALVLLPALHAPAVMLLTPPILAGLWLTHSWGAGLALLAAAAVWWPRPVLLIAVLIALVAAEAFREWSAGRSGLVLRWLNRTPRGGSFDSLAHRVRAWRAYGVVWCRWPIWCWGRGPGAGPRDAVDVQAHLSHPIQVGPLHNDWLEFAYEHGVLGLAVIALLVARVAPHLAWADPWTAAVLVGAVIALGSPAMRVQSLGSAWLLTAAWVCR